MHPGVGCKDPAHRCPAGWYRCRYHPRKEVILYRSGHLIPPGRASLCDCRCPKGIVRVRAASQHTRVGRDEGVCPYGRGCIRGGARELAGGGCWASANWQGRSPQPALPSAGRGAGMSPVSGRGGAARVAARRGPQPCSGAGAEPRRASGSARREGPAALARSAAGRDRPGPRRGAETDAWHLWRGRWSFPRCHTEMAQQGFHECINPAVYLSSVIAPLDLKCRMLGCISWQAIN